MTTQNYKLACIFGGSGFVGRQIVRELARLGYTIKVASRTPERAYFLRTAGTVGQIVPVACDYQDDSSIRAAVRGCELVVNCVGILYEKNNNSFAAIHTELPRAIAKACRVEDVRRFIHFSALGCDHAASKYGKSKYAGERTVLENFPRATILRPATIFGAEDNFFNLFARLSVVLPVLPLIGGGDTKFQPVYVGDVADAVIITARHDDCSGKTYELGGPDILTFRQLYARIFKETSRPRPLMPLPWGLAKLQGAILGLFPTPILTVDQVETLKSDSVVGLSALTLRDLGISATSMDVILPGYLARYRPGGRFGDKKRA